LRTPFSYKSSSSRFSLVTVWLCDSLAQMEQKLLVKC
jgi:hypothetical protein